MNQISLLAEIHVFYAHSSTAANLGSVALAVALAMAVTWLVLRRR